MNIALINLDLIGSEALAGVSSHLWDTFLISTTYSETQHPVLQSSGSTFLANGLIDCAHESVRIVFGFSPGYKTIKFFHDFIKLQLARKGNVEIVLHLPEHKKIQLLENADRFKYEAFYTYLSTCISLGYSHLSTTCVSDECSEFYANAMLGGFRPQVRTTFDLISAFGIANARNSLESV